MAAGKLTHLDEGGAARMVDVGAKAESRREAVAECFVPMAPATLAALRASELAKGDALGVARVAGILGAKRTSDLIPLCHPLPVSSVEVQMEVGEAGVRILVTARVTGHTGVEMEALTGAAVAGLTLIDMVKGMERGVHLRHVRLVRKSGGRSGEWVREGAG